MSAVLTLIKFAAERRECDAVSRLVRVAEPMLTLAGRWESCREALTLGLRAADALHDQATQALFHHQLGTLALCSDEIDVARRHLAQALELREALNDRRGAQATRHNLDLLPIGWFSRTWRAVRSPAVARSLIALFVLVPIIIAGAGTVAATGGGDGVQLQVDPAGLNFGTQAVNTASAPSALTVRNPGNRPAGLNAVTVAGPAASDFAIGTDGCGQTALAAGSSCQVLLSFSPTAEGRREGTLKITDAATGTEWVATLAGVGLRTGASLTSDPSALDFPDQRLGRSSPSQTITITNGTDATQELGSVILVGPNEDEFRVAESNCGARALPSGKNCRIAVTFTPAAEGNRAAMVQLAVPGPLPDVVIPVSGRGLPVSSGPPTITVPPGLVREAFGPNGAVVKYVASAEDSRGEPLNPTCQRASGDTFPIGTSTVNCRATDAAGRTATAAFDVEVRDTVGPEIKGPEDRSIEAVDAKGADFTVEPSTATDLVSGPVQVTCDAGAALHLDVDESQVITCRAQDAAGNRSSRSFAVHVVDTTPPELSGVDDIVRYVGAGQSVIVTYQVNASDRVSGEVAVDCRPPSGSGFGFNTETDVRCSATDAHGNTQGPGKVAISGC